MRSIPDISVKRVGDAVQGELIRASVYGSPALGFLTSTKIADSSQTLGLWLELAGDRSEPELRYVEDDANCMSYGDDWAIEPEMSNLFAYSRDACVMLHRSAGWLLRSATVRSQFGWFSITDGRKVETASRNDAVFFTSYRITVAAGLHRETEVFA